MTGKVKVLVTIYIPKELLDKVEKFWKEQSEDKSRNEFIVELIERGLEVVEGV